MQTIVDDLSTYSAHLVASRIMLSSVQPVGPRAMVLVDEAGTGTDPQQGAALARAMLEAFLESGARVVATTHCVQLKNWATEDERTMTAAMEYKSGRPTYRLSTNSVLVQPNWAGTSFAFLGGVVVPLVRVATTIDTPKPSRNLNPTKPLSAKVWESLMPWKQPSGWGFPRNLYLVPWICWRKIRETRL